MFTNIAIGPDMDVIVDGSRFLTYKTAARLQGQGQGYQVKTKCTDKRQAPKIKDRHRQF